MSYLGYIKAIFEGYPLPSEPVVLEIGIDQGHSTLSIVQNLASRFEKSVYFGCDIRVEQRVFEQLINFKNVSLEGIETFKELKQGCHVFGYESNSLMWLKEMTPDWLNKKLGLIDIAFVDGDHNYYTVSNELRMLKRLIKPESIIVCDDYNGKWSTRDGFYSEVSTHKDIGIATQRVDLEKKGVKPAVIDFLGENPEWKCWTHPDVDPAILYRRDVWEDVILPRKDFELFSRCKFEFTRRKTENV